MTNNTAYEFIIDMHKLEYKNEEASLQSNTVPLMPITTLNI